MIPFFFGPRQITAEEVEGRRKPIETREREEVIERGRIPDEVEWSREDCIPNKSGSEGPQISISINPVCVAESKSVPFLREFKQELFSQELPFESLNCTHVILSFFTFAQPPTQHGADGTFPNSAFPTQYQHFMFNILQPLPHCVEIWIWTFRCGSTRFLVWTSCTSGGGTGREGFGTLFERKIRSAGSRREESGRETDGTMFWCISMDCEQV